MFLLAKNADLDASMMGSNILLGSALSVSGLVVMHGIGITMLNCANILS